MSFVQGKCETCGGILTVDPSLKAANCPFCGAAYVVQDSINYYNTNIKIENMHADVVNMSDESSSEGRLKAAEAFMRLGKFEKAELEYKKVTELTPQNYKGWLGLIESKTHNYSKRIRSSKELKNLSDYSRSVKLFASDESHLIKFEEYLKNEIKKNTSETIAYNKEIAERTANWEQLNIQNQSLTITYNQNQDRISSLNFQLNKLKNSDSIAVLIIWIIILIFVGVVFGVFIYRIGRVVFVLSLLIAGIPTAILIYKIVKKNRLQNELTRLSSEQEKIHLQIRELIDKENAYKSSIKTIKMELGKYV